MELMRRAFRVVRGISPSFGARLGWTRLRWQGNAAVRVVDMLVHPGDTVVDAGANWGLYTWRLSLLVGPTGCVHAFDRPAARIA